MTDSPFSPDYATLVLAQRHLLVCACVSGLTRPMSALCWRSSSWKSGTSSLSGGGNNKNNQFDEREQVESNILLASRLQDHNSALFIQVFKKKSREFQALVDSFWCIRSSKTSTKSGASWCYVHAVWLCVHARGLFNVRIRLRPSYWRWSTVNLQAGTHAPRHRRAHTPFFEDLFMQEAVFLNVALCHRCKRGKVG